MAIYAAAIGEYAAGGADGDPHFQGHEALAQHIE
jgi:hypothetical protein